MGSYQTTAQDIQIQPNDNMSQPLSTYKCAIEMAKSGKNSIAILELVNRNVIPVDSSDEDYNRAISILNDLMFAMASNNDDNSEEILKLDSIINSIIYDRDHRNDSSDDE